MESRKKAMVWWNSLSLEEKFYKVIPWLKGKGINVTERHPDSLTGREIEEIWLNETQLPKLGTKEFNDLASSYFGGKPKEN